MFLGWSEVNGLFEAFGCGPPSYHEPNARNFFPNTSTCTHDATPSNGQWRAGARQLALQPMHVIQEEELLRWKRKWKEKKTVRRKREKRF